jgi:Holliday junction resolvase
MNNNKKIGTAFENECCDVLAKMGFWVHFIVPDARGAQPFDIIAVKDGRAIAIDCKTCVAKRFTISRLEEDQVTSFEKWLRCGNLEPVILIKHKEEIYSVGYNELKEKKSVVIEELKKVEVEA